MAFRRDRVRDIANYLSRFLQGDDTSRSCVSFACVLALRREQAFKALAFAFIEFNWTP